MNVGGVVEPIRVVGPGGDEVVVRQVIDVCRLLYLNGLSGLRSGAVNIMVLVGGRGEGIGSGGDDVEVGGIPVWHFGMFGGVVRVIRERA